MSPVCTCSMGSAVGLEPGPSPSSERVYGTAAVSCGSAMKVRESRVIRPASWRLTRYLARAHTPGPLGCGTDCMQMHAGPTREPPHRRGSGPSQESPSIRTPPIRGRVRSSNALDRNWNWLQASSRLLLAPTRCSLLCCITRTPPWRRKSVSAARSTLSWLVRTVQRSVHQCNPSAA